MRASLALLCCAALSAAQFALLCCAALSAAQFDALQSYTCLETVEHFENGVYAGTSSYQVHFEDGAEHYSPRVQHVHVWSEGEYGYLLRSTEHLLQALDIDPDDYEDASTSFEVPAESNLFTFSPSDTHGHYRLPFTCWVLFDADDNIASIQWRAHDLPRQLRIRQITWTVVFDVIHQVRTGQLLPVTAQFSVLHRDGSEQSNFMRFTDYKRYGAQSNIYAVDSTLR